MNATPKKNVKAVLREQTRKFAKPEQSVDLLLAEPADFKKIWAEEIAELKSQTYLNLEAAVSALVQAVVKRFYPGAQKKEVCALLSMYIENDPDLLEQIESILLKKAI